MYRSVNTMLLNLETCTAYDHQLFDTFASSANTAALMNYIDSLDPQVCGLVWHHPRKAVPKIAVPKTTVNRPIIECCGTEGFFLLAAFFYGNFENGLSGP